LSKHKSEQRPERFGVGDKIDAKIIVLDPREHKVSLSVKAYEVEEEKRTIAEYGSVDSGASLGDILGKALANNKSAKEEKEEPKKAAKKATSKKKEASE
jgi:small subunit ribosomal protein S1